MKSTMPTRFSKISASLPVRGAWVEICQGIWSFDLIMSLPVRGAWVEISSVKPQARRRWSFPVRGAWVEMT